MPDRQKHPPEGKERLRQASAWHGEQDEWNDSCEADWDVGPALTRQQALDMFGVQAMRDSRVTPWRVIVIQFCVALLSGLAWFLGGAEAHAQALGFSAFLGGAICFVPSAVFAARLSLSRTQPGVMALVAGEALKIGLTIGLFAWVAVAYSGVHWAPLLLTYVLALKVYWLALAIR